MLSAFWRSFKTPIAFQDAWPHQELPAAASFVAEHEVVVPAQTPDLWCQPGGNIGYAAGGGEECATKYHSGPILCDIRSAMLSCEDIARTKSHVVGHPCTFWSNLLCFLLSSVAESIRERPWGQEWLRFPMGPGSVSVSYSGGSDRFSRIYVIPLNI